ncbi:MAG: amidohydrolase family protein, partial [Pseudomonadota bacterium]
IDEGVAAETVISLMDENNVHVTILATRGRPRPEAVVDLSDRYSGRIVPSVRTKGRHSDFEVQVRSGRFRAMAEVLLYHARKGSGAPEQRQMPSSMATRNALALTRKMSWPFVMHIEFAALPQDRAKQYMEETEELLSSNPDHNFVLIHMGQLPAKEVGRLLSKYPNLHFFPSHSNPVTISDSKEPWVNIFDGRRLAPEWKALFLRYPKNFLFALDNVWPKHWGRPYGEQVVLWREALQELPLEVAELFAHGNAERLWKLASVPGGK